VLKPDDVDVDRLLTLLFVELRPVDRLEMPLVAVLRPDDVEVDRLLTLLFVELRPVERLEMLLVAVLRPDDVEVDRLLTLLLVVLSPVDRLAMPLETEVDSDVNWPKFTASVGFAPAATLVRTTGAAAPTPPRVILVWLASSY
jgi:hypothetical protein